MPASATSWIDRVTAPIAPRWTLKRVRARAVVDVLRRHYEGAGTGRRTQGWKGPTGDANAIVGPALSNLRYRARDLVRNNGHAESALSTIVDHTCGWGIVAKPKPKNARAMNVWRAWAETTACDADGRHDFYGLQALAFRTVVESGEVLIRRRPRLLSDGLPLPMQIQILDPDFLDSSKDRQLGAGLARIVQGVEYDAIGKRVGYWLFKEHPGSLFGSAESVRVPAENIRHMFRATRPGQVRGLSWYAPVLLRFKDYDDYADATLMKQKVAACLSVITTDPLGAGPALGEVDPDKPEIDSLEPGAILNVPAGRTIQVVNPPTVREHTEYSTTTLREIATGLGVTYEDLTGDYADMPFSAARMSWLRHWARVDGWRWKILIPQFCDPVWRWAMEVAAVMDLVGDEDVPVAWTAPPPPMIDPAAEGLAYLRNIRAGIISWSEAVRERGFDPEELLAEIAQDFDNLERLGVVLDIDPRKMTQAGQAQSLTAPPAGDTSAEDPPPGPRPPNDAADDNEEDDAADRRLVRVGPVRLGSGTYGRR